MIFPRIWGVAILGGLLLSLDPLPACAEQATRAAATRVSVDTPPPLPNRWVYSFGYGRTPQGVATIKSLIETAADHDLNGIMLASFGMDSVTRWGKRDRGHFQEVLAHAASHQVEVIPTGLNVGYGGGALSADRSFAAALPVTLTVRRQGNVLQAVNGPELMRNSGFEVHRDNHFEGYNFIDGPGVISFADPDAIRGKLAVRFENFTANIHGHARLMQEAKVTAGRRYRLTFQIRSEAVTPVGGLKAMILIGDRVVAKQPIKIASTAGWTEVTLDYISTEDATARVYGGMWGGESGRFWIDAFSFREHGDFADTVRRHGAPLALVDDTGRHYVEGADFAQIPCLRSLPEIAVPARSEIPDQAVLQLRCYQIPSVGHPWGDQVSLCMSNPALYAYWETQVQALYALYPFKRFLLSMDEIRNGGGCQACRQNGLTMGELLGRCITQQFEILKRLDPDMEVLIWSDMLDPAHNAHSGYYGVVGDISGGWKHIPREVVVMCWSHELRERSLGFFASHCFQTMGAAYYDGEDLSNPRDWLESLRHTPQSLGIMYTSWEQKYELLGAFGDLLAPSAD